MLAVFVVGRVLRRLRHLVALAALVGVVWIAHPTRELHSLQRGHGVGGHVVMTMRHSLVHHLRGLADGGRHRH